MNAFEEILEWLDRELQRMHKGLLGAESRSGSRLWWPTSECIEELAVCTAKTLSQNDVLTLVSYTYFLMPVTLLQNGLQDQDYIL